MGWNSQPTTIVNFDNCVVPKSNLIGKKGEGFKIAMIGLDGGRINIASCSIGGAAFALEHARDYIKVRKAFGKTLSENQYLQFKLAEMATNLKASRLIVRAGATMIDNNDENKTTYSAMAKTFATSQCFDVYFLIKIILDS
jgi:alkylation response protein AidB-like acyl-CoA dehydrogenase